MLRPISLLLDFGGYMEGALRWEGAVRWMEAALPVLHTFMMLVVCSWIAVLLPLSCFRKAHPFVVAALRKSSWAIGGVCLWQAFIATYRMLGGRRGATLRRDWRGADGAAGDGASGELDCFRRRGCQFDFDDCSARDRRVDRKAPQQAESDGHYKDIPGRWLLNRKPDHGTQTR